MNYRNFQGGPAGNLDMAQMQLSVAVNGRTYCICDSVQFAQMVNGTMEIAANELISAINKRGETGYPPEAEIKALATKKIENMGYATLDMVLSKMTPQQLQEWKDSYRFTPITRRMS
jgi:hypothetical protein